MTTMISKSYTDQGFGGNPNDLQKVEIFRDRVTGWQLDIAKEIVRQIDVKPPDPIMNHAGYAVLAILTNYFEMIWQHIDGSSSNHDSANYFARGFKEVYKTTPLSHDEIKSIVYHRLRCGMYHDGYTRRGVTIKHDYGQDIEYVRADDELKVNPHTMVGTLETHFTGYIATLQADITARNKFLAIFNRTMPPPSPALAPTPPPSPTPPPAPTPVTGDGVGTGGSTPGSGSVPTRPPGPSGSSSGGGSVFGGGSGPGPSGVR